MLKRKPTGPAAKITGWLIKRARQEPSSLARTNAFSRKLKRRKFWTQNKATVISRPVRNFHTAYMPNMFQTRFVYTSSVGFTVGAASVAYNLYRGNSIYDPDYTGVGTRANGASEMANIYNKYKVMGSRITVSAQGKTVTDSLRITVYPTADTTNPTNAVVLSHPNGVRASINENLDTKKLTNYMRSSILWGLTSVDETNFTSNMNGSPANVWFWVVAATGSENDQVALDVVIEYYTVCFDLKTTYQAAL